MADESNHPVIIIKRVKKGHDAAHGGGWKVAYADFVTAMMAFFLLLWLLNATDQEKRQGIAQYFTAFDAVSRSTSGAGGVLGGVTLGPGDLPNMTGGIVVGVPLAPTGEKAETEGPDFADPKGAANEDTENPQPNARGASGVAAGPSGRETLGERRPGDRAAGNQFSGNRPDGDQNGSGAGQNQNSFQQQMPAQCDRDHGPYGCLALPARGPVHELGIVERPCERRTPHDDRIGPAGRAHCPRDRPRRHRAADRRQPGRCAQSADFDCTAPRHTAIELTRPNAKLASEPAAVLG